MTHGTKTATTMTELPTKAGSVIRWKYRYDGVFQYQIAVLSIHHDYEQGLAWHRTGWSEPWSAKRMQDEINDSWGEWTVVCEGDEDD